MRLVEGLLCFAVLAPLAWGEAVLDDGPATAPFESLIKAGQFAEAEPLLTAYAAQHPDSWRAQYQLGYLWFRTHRIQQSLTAVCRSLVLNGDFAESHKILAFDLNILGHPDRAAKELKRAIALDPASAESHYELGRIYYEQGAYLDATRELEQAKRLAPESVRTYHNLGLAYAAVSDQAKAVANFEEGLERNRQQAHPSAWPLIDYAAYFNLQGNWERACQLLTEAIAIDDRWDRAFDELSKAERGLGKTKEAIEALRRATVLNEGKAEYHYVLAQLYKQTNQPAAARQELERYEEARAKTK